MASIPMVNYRDPNPKNLAKPLVDIAASSQSWIWLVWLESWGWAAVLLTERSMGPGMILVVRKSMNKDSRSQV